MATYLTDSWSTVSGLASVAYGSPDRYPEVANQVRSKSVTGFLGTITPSEVIGNRLGREDFVRVLVTEYGRGEEFARYVDGEGETVEAIASRFYDKVIESYNEFSTYESSLTDAMEYVGIPVNTGRVRDDLVRSVADLELFDRLANSVPQGKLDKLPSGARISLDDTAPLDKDHNGISFPVGYLTPSQYFDDIAYPGAGQDGNNLPGTIVDSLIQGYQGYSTTQPLDDLLRPGLAAIMSLADIRDLRGVNRAVAGLGSIDTLKDLTGLGSMSPADQLMYSVDLADLVADINGYTTYVPETDSNGDYLDPELLPNYQQENADSGLPYSQRPRTSTFDN